MQEMLEYRYHARDLQIASLYQKDLTKLEQEANTLKEELTAYFHLMVGTPYFLINEIGHQLFQNPAQKSEMLSAAIIYNTKFNLIRYLYAHISRAASDKITTTVNLDSNADFLTYLPSYELIFPEPETIKHLIKEATTRASDLFIESFAPKLPIIRPRRDIALRMYPVTAAISPRESIFLVPSDVEGIHLKLVYLENAAFPIRSIYIQSLDQSTSNS